jgi:predicted acylesterase/phospholipase RssA/CRP-like cAMP-binding protein
MSERPVETEPSASERFASLDLVTDIAPAHLEAIASELELIKVPAGGTLLRQGASTDGMYWLVDGRLAVTRSRDDGTVDHLGEIARGEPVGEIGLLRDSQRNADVRALRDCALVRISDAGFRRLIELEPGAVDRFTRVMEARERPSAVRPYRPSAAELVSFLRSTSLFSSLDAAALAAFEDEFQWLSIASGEVLMRAGERGDCLFLVVSGRLRVFVERADGAEQAVGEVGQGECVGEMALLTEEPRTGTARAIRDSEVVRLSRKGFDRLWREHPDATRGLARLIVQRLRRLELGRGAAEHTTTLALVPTSPDVPLEQVAALLAEGLGTPEQVLHLNARTLDQHLGPGASRLDASDPRSRGVVQWLNAREGRHRTILYEADLSATPWTRRCLRQADRILLVGNASGSPAPGEIEFELDSLKAQLTGPKCELVLLHEPGSRQVRHTRQWLDARQVDAHHHLRRGDLADHARLARLLSGRGIGLVLGGGGARGFAHIGVLRAFREAGIPIDAIGGTSMGAVIAGQHALGLPDTDLLDLNRDAWVRLKPLSDYTIPMVSMIRGRKVEKVLREMYGDARIEDLRVPYYCVTSNLTRAVAQAHTDGELWRWVRASVSIPGIGPPAFHDGELHVDGAILNNLPGDVMRSLGKGPVIAVDVSLDASLAVGSDLREFPSGWSLLRHRLGLGVGAPPAVPGLFDILFRTAMLASSKASKQAREDADLCLVPPVGQFKLLQFEAIDEIVELGYRYAERRLEEWRSGGFALG